MNGTFNLAVHALVYLSHCNCSLSSEKLAENICTNAARVRKIMSGLKKAGIVETHEGQDGGYKLKKDAGTLTLEDVADAVNADFVSCRWHSGNMEKNCCISAGFGVAMDELYGELNKQCRDYLSEITIRDMEKKLTEGDL